MNQLFYPEEDAEGWFEAFCSYVDAHFPPRKRSKVTRRPSTISNRQRTIPLTVMILAFAHMFRYFKSSWIFRAFPNARPTNLSNAIATLLKRKFIRSLGFAKCDPTTGFAGEWYMPTKKPPDYQGIFNNKLHCKISPISIDSGRTALNGLLTSKRYFIPNHDLNVAFCATTISGCGHFPLSELYLREIKLWFQGPKQPSSLFSGDWIVRPVPDIFVKVGEQSYLLEIEMSRRDEDRLQFYFKGYAKYPTTRLIWVAEDEVLARSIHETHKRMAGRPWEAYTDVESLSNFMRELENGRISIDQLYIQH